MKIKSSQKSIKSLVTLRTYPDAWIITVKDSVGFKADMAVTKNEALQLYQLLDKAIEKNIPTQTKRVQKKTFRVFEDSLKETYKKIVSKKGKQTKDKRTPKKAVGRMSKNHKS